MKKIVLLTILIGGVLLGCKKSETEFVKEETKESTIVKTTENFVGKDVIIEYEKPVTRAISMSQATTEMLLVLGLNDKMVGTAFLEEPIYEKVAKEYEKVEVIADKWPSYEVFMSKKPDFTTGWATAFTKRGIEADKILESGVKIFVPNSMKSVDADLETFFQDMLTYGKIFGVEERAEKFVAEQREKLNILQEKMKNEARKRVFIFDVSDDKPFTVFEGYTTNILKLIGAENVMSNQGIEKTWEATSYENIVKTNPEYILIVEYIGNRNDSDFEGKKEILLKNEALKDVDAIKNNKILKVKLSEITPGIRTVDTLERLAQEMNSIR